MNLVLIGYRGCGKSIVGSELATRLAWPLVDCDAMIEQRAHASIREIIAARGETGFRDLESEVVRAVSDLDQHVISTGGGVIIRPENVRLLKQHGRIVWLTASAETLWRRILDDPHRRETRPAPDLEKGLEQIRQALSERNPIYQRVADLQVDTENRSVASVAGDILSQLGLEPSGS